MSKNINRRDFLKTLGIGSAGMFAPVVVGETARGLLVESEEEYGGFLVEQLNGGSGSGPYQYDPDAMEPYSEKRTIFSRNKWEPERQDRAELTTDANLTSSRLVEGEGKVPNQTRLDYALMAASWATAGMGHGETGPYAWDVQTGMIHGMGLARLGPWDPADLDMSWEDATLAAKHASLFYGASLAGVAEVNPLWLYADHYADPGTDEESDGIIPVIRDEDRFEKTDEAWYIPESMNRAIVLAFEEDYDGIANSPGRLASAAVGNGYSRMANTAFFVAEFIRCLGYRALPAGNGIGLSIPLAIDAGLGELGRNGLLMTPKYGPRVRIAKVFTDMPLVPDSPINFGVEEFCKACKLCATECPSGSISADEQTMEGPSISSFNGALKWYVAPEGCYDFNGFSCSNCKRVCPFNKPNNSWLHQVTRAMVNGKVGLANNLMVQADQLSGYGVQVEDTEFWKQDGSATITAREAK